jgi:hypothetical protein
MRLVNATRLNGAHRLGWHRSPGLKFVTGAVNLIRPSTELIGDIEQPLYRSAQWKLHIADWLRPPGHNRGLLQCRVRFRLAAARCRRSTILLNSLLAMLKTHCRLQRQLTGSHELLLVTATRHKRATSPWLAWIAGAQVRCGALRN